MFGSVVAGDVHELLTKTGGTNEKGSFRETYSRKPHARRKGNRRLVIRATQSKHKTDPERPVNSRENPRNED